MSAHTLEWVTANTEATASISTPVKTARKENAVTKIAERDTESTAGLVKPAPELDRVSSSTTIKGEPTQTLLNLKEQERELEELIKIKDAKILELSEKIKVLETRIYSESVIEREAFECDQCGKIYKSDNGMKIHKGKAHKKVTNQPTPDKECSTAGVGQLPVSSPKATRKDSEDPHPHNALWPHIVRKGKHAKQVDLQCSMDLAGCGVPRHNEERGDFIYLCKTCRWKGALFSCRTA